MTDPGTAVRAAAPGGLALFAALGVAMSERPLAVSLVAGGAVVALSIVLARRDVSDWLLAVGLAPVVAGLAVLGHATAANLAWMGLCVLIGWIALTSQPVVAVASTVPLGVLLAVEWLLEMNEPGWAAWVTGTTFTMVACLFSRRLRITVEELRAAQHRLAERSRAEERSRIAGEVHDVIGHALTVSLLHLDSARLALDDEPEQARRSLVEAARQTRASLEEVRTSVGLLRTDAPDRTTPLPTAADIGELVESFRRAGSDVELTVTGDLSALGPTRGLSAYRIVQEALTNATRHAPGSPAAVVVDVDGRRAAVTVHNAIRPGAAGSGTGPAVGTAMPAARIRLRDATSPAAAGAGTDPLPGTAMPAPGTGLRGMRERAESVGGRLVAGADTSRTEWVVEAVLPT